jgi:hypothetical protein
MPHPTDRTRAALPSGLALLGIGGCALCCAVPLLLAAGVLSGGVAAALSDWMPGIAAALLATAGLAWWNLRRRARSSCSHDEGNDGSCSCAS